MELIKIEQKEGKSVVSARDLYEFLESKKDFSDWIKFRLDKYGFIEGEDFTTFEGKSTGGRPSKEYALTLDTAKELAMVEANEKGQQARRYFIACEKKLKENSLPQTFAQALRLAAEQQELIELQAAKVQNLEQALDKSEQWISILRAAQELGKKETDFNWRILKQYSLENGIELKEAPCPRFTTKKLYHVSVFKKCYPHYYSK